MRRFMLFGFDAYYPVGGMHDFVESFDTIDEVHAWVKAHGEKEVYQYVDTADWTWADMDI